MATQFRAMVLGLALQWALKPDEVDVSAIVEPYLGALRRSGPERRRGPQVPVLHGDCRRRR